MPRRSSIDYRPIFVIHTSNTYHDMHIKLLDYWSNVRLSMAYIKEYAISHLHSPALWSECKE